MTKHFPSLVISLQLYIYRSLDDMHRHNLQNIQTFIDEVQGELQVVQEKKQDLEEGLALGSNSL